MGNTISIKKINFEDMQNMIKDANTVIINTLLITKQQCLIYNTIPASKETDILNDLLQNNVGQRIVIYGMNSCDNGITAKCNQLLNLGFTNVYVYGGGIFEWLLLQDMFSYELFPTTTKELDILQFKGEPITQRLQLRY